MNARWAAVPLLLLMACERAEQRIPPAAPAAQPSPAQPWTWRPLGSLAVVEGEVAAPTELILEGRSIRERRFAEPGPVRWEFYRPPEGEVAVLRTADHQELARFTFALPSRPARREASPLWAEWRKPSPRPSSRPPEAVPAETAKIRAEARLKDLPSARIPARKTPSLLERFEVPLRTPAAPPPINLLPDPAALPPFSPAAPAWPGMGEALNLTRGPSGGKRLLLSFDGGSTAEVAEEVLDLLKARGIRTTLFLTGAFIQRFPALVARMAAEGHELGNHTMNHPHFAPGMKRDPKWTRERVQRELLEADQALVRLLGRPMDPVWRAPYGEHTAEIRRWAEELGYRHVGWSEGADTLDWATPRDRKLYRSGHAIVRRLHQRLDRNGEGLIVLMHLGSERDEGDRPTDGLGDFIDRAQREGWRFVSAGDLLRDLGKPAWDRHQRLALMAGTPSEGR